MSAIGGRIGFMQGRLSLLVKGRIQAFPAEHWREEFAAAEALGLRLMEWTLDQEGLRENPLCTAEGRREIRGLCAAHGLSVPSLTGDCFMQAPFWKAEGERRAALLGDLRLVLEAAADLGVAWVVVPLVDDGRVEDDRQRDSLLRGLAEVQGLLGPPGPAILFESDLPPAALAAFVAPLDPRRFGVNYDIGNSAALGFDPAREMASFGHRVRNVHVKDRVLGGTTVPLGAGAADLRGAVRALAGAGYRGNYILQTARAADGNHAAALARYRDMTAAWIEEGEHGSALAR